MAVSVCLLSRKLFCKLSPLFKSQLWRNLSFSYICHSTFDRNQLPKQARILNKLINRDRRLKKKTWYWSEPQVATSKYFDKGKQITNSRRIQVLNALFMEKITDVMSTGEIGSELQGYGIEILFVKVSPDFTHVSVYWTSGLSDPDDNLKKIEHLLALNASKIRSELIGQHILGIVPKLNFVRDKIYSRAAEVERLLTVADFGPDYVQQETMLETKIPQSLHECFEERISNFANRYEPEISEEYQFPESSSYSQEDIQNETTNLEDKEAHNYYSYPSNMRLDVLGLDYKDLIEKIIIKKTTYRNVKLQETCDTEIPGEALSILSYTERKERLKSFLQLRQKMQAKERNRFQNFDCDFETNYSAELNEVEEEEDYFDEEQHYNDRHYIDEHV